MVNGVTTDDGCRIACRFDGAEGAPILLLSNSLGTTMAMWDPQMAAFTRDFRVLRYDCRGHGQSGVPSGAYSIDRLGRDVIALLDTLELGKVDFCGLSLGGMIGQWLALRAPERIGRLVLANTSAFMGPPSNWQGRIDAVLADGVAPLADASVARWFTAGFADRDPGAVASIRAMLLANHAVGYAGCCAAIRDMDQRATASLNTRSTLVIAGRFDPATPMADGEFLVAQAQHARLAVLESAHLSNVECPRAFASAVLDFLHAA